MSASPARFTLARERSALPYRDRAPLAPGGLAIGDDVDGFAVHITATAVDALLTGTAAADPREAFGLLVGRGFTDGLGSWTLVTGVAYARPDECDASGGHVHVRAAAMEQLRRRAM
jgi:hypothetical protein